ncbi:MAG: hypothetical protein M3N95_08005 [Actinomycetota bacterium]|nr:hypothetical protein [Actinomycetota bacterium]
MRAARERSSADRRRRPDANGYYTLNDLSGCPYIFDIAATVSGTRTSVFLHYTNGHTTDSFTYQTGFDHPGNFSVAIVVQGCSARDSSNHPVPIQWSADTTGIKFASQAYIARERHGSAVYINALVHEYSDYQHNVRGAGRAVYLQRYLPAGRQTMLMRTSGSDGKIVVGFIQPNVYQYRVVVVEDGLHFAAYSASTFR